MSAGSWVFTTSAKKHLIDGGFDIDTDVYKMALFASVTNIAAATIEAFSGCAGEVASVGTGYTAGGVSVALTLAGTATVVADVGTDPSWTAGSSGLIARYAAIYEVGGNVLCYCPLESASTDVTITAGNTLTVAANASGVFTIA